MVSTVAKEVHAINPMLSQNEMSSTVFDDLQYTSATQIQVYRWMKNMSKS